MWFNGWSKKTIFSSISTVFKYIIDEILKNFFLYMMVNFWHISKRKLLLYKIWFIIYIYIYIYIYTYIQTHLLTKSIYNCHLLIFIYLYVIYYTLQNYQIDIKTFESVKHECKYNNNNNDNNSLIVLIFLYKW